MTRQGGRAPIRERDMVAASLPAGLALQALLHECWDAGAALLPLDPRLPARARDVLVAAAAPTVVVGEGGATRPDGLGAEPGDALVIATSGTTGRPRLVVLTRDAITAAVHASATRLRLDGSEPWLLCIPPWHIGGMLVLLRNLLLGVPLVVHDGFDVDAVIDAVRLGGVQCMSLVPTQLHRLVERLDETGARLDALRAVLVGGDALDPALRKRATALGIPLVHTYGQSQSCGGVVYDGVPLDGVEVTISDEGEVLLGGPTLMRGYRLEAALDPVDRRARLRTGDGGHLDGEGRLVVTGRLDDVIVTGGEKVVPGEVERVLREVPGVADVAVVGAPDAEWGRRVVAVVVPADGASITLDALRDAGRAVLPPYALPRQLVIVTSVPRTEAGKVQRAELRELVSRAP